jgi:ATP-dependent Clp protease ATP-binding subunit ClpA
VRRAWRRPRPDAEARPAEPYLFAGAREARRLGHDIVGTEHVLLAMLRNDHGDACRLLRQVDVSPRAVEETLDLGPVEGARIDAAALASLGIDFYAIRDRLEASFGEGALEAAHASCLGIQPRLKIALAAAVEHAGDGPLRDADVMLGILRVPDSYAACVLAKLGATAEAIAAAAAAEA